MYGVFLLIQTKTHQSLFVYEHEDDGDDDDPHHGKPSAHSSKWHTAWLLIHLVAVIAVTKMNANPLETLLTSMNAPVAFTGFLVALLILSPEGLGALKAVLNNQVQRAMNLFFGSVLCHHFPDGAGGDAYRLPHRQRTALWPWRAGNGGDGRLAAAVPDIVLYRAYQRAERRGAPGAVRRLPDDHFCLNLPRRRPPVGEIKKACRFCNGQAFVISATVTCWYRAHRSL